jgi:hypothetical protein
MGRPRKVPAVLVEATIRENGKLAALPSDTARLGYFYICLGAAKLLNPPGMFSSQQHFKEVAGRFAKYISAYELTGLVEVAPKLCARCRERWSNMPPKKGQIVVHDWHEFQYDPLKIERQRQYEERQRAPQSDPVSDVVSDPVSDAQSDAVSSPIPTEFPTPISRTREARSRGERRTLNVEEGESQASKNVTARAAGQPSKNGAEPRLTKAQLQAWATFEPKWDPFKAVWLARGFLHPPAGSPDGDDTSQRGLLFQVLDAWPNAIVGWAREAPGKTSREVIDYILERWHEKREEAGATEDWFATPGPSKSEAAESVGAILSRLAAVEAPA